MNNLIKRSRIVFFHLYHHNLGFHTKWMSFCWQGPSSFLSRTESVGIILFRAWRDMDVVILGVNPLYILTLFQKAINLLLTTDTPINCHATNCGDVIFSSAHSSACCCCWLAQTIGRHGPSISTREKVGEEEGRVTRNPNKMRSQRYSIAYKATDCYVDM